MEWLISFISNGYTIVTIVGAAVVFVFQRIKTDNERFKQYASDLYREDNQTAQITSAILLRSYLTPKWLGLNFSYVKSTLNLIAAILRHTQNGNLQKTLADSISFVGNADGQDFQNANMYKCSIKPNSRKQFEITGEKRMLEKRISLRGADFFKANISYSGLYCINAEKAVFYESALDNTTFHNCILRNADFRAADVHNLKFKNCQLDGANFAGARRLDTVKIYTGDNNEKVDYLLNYLDKDGVFVGLQSKPQYPIQDTPKKIFISKLGAMNTKQKFYFSYLTKYLESQYNYEFVQIEPEEYRDSGQIEMIVNRMSECSGILIFAFAYIHIDNGNMVGLSNLLRNEEHISPWLQIEAAMANALYKLPCMVIAEEGVCCNGIFDSKIIKSEELLSRLDYKGKLSESDAEVFLQWSRMVDKHYFNK